MTDSNEVKESSEDKPELVKDMDVGDEKHKEGREEVEEDDEEEDDDEEDIEEDTEESDEDEEDEHEKEVQPGSEDVSDDSRNELNAEVSLAKNPNVNTGSPSDAVGNRKADGGDEKEALRPDTEDGGDAKLDGHDSHTHQSVNDEITPRSHTGVDAHINGSSALKVELMEEDLKNEANTKEGTMDVENGHPNVSCIFDTDTSGGGESGTEDEQAAFMNELEKFHKEKLLEFKPPKFYGEPLNLLKLWRAVMRLGGYDKVTACKYWRQVGESFKPPKTCTTVSWTFRIFYEKALLEYERYRTSGDGTGIPTSLTVPMSVENQVSGSGRARRDAAARAMQGWHSQRILDNGEVSDPIIKDKNTTSLSKRDKQLKNLGMLKRKKPSSMDAAVKDVRAKVPKTQSETTVIDIGSPADWVKINVRVTKDCYEVYALVPGLLREEVRVQSDPAGRLVISGEPENPDNPWSVTPFKKVVNLPSRIDPHQTSAVVTLHGQLFVRVPFEQYD